MSVQVRYWLQLDVCSTFAQLVELYRALITEKRYAHTSCIEMDKNSLTYWMTGKFY